MSPEQVQNARTVDFRTDYYSLGASIFHLVTGNPPYDGDSRFAVMTRHVNDPVPFAREHRPDLTISFSHLISRLMAKDPSLRPASTDDILALVEVCERVGATGVDMELAEPDAPIEDLDQVPASDTSGGKKAYAPLVAITVGSVLLAAAAVFAVTQSVNRKRENSGVKLEGADAASVLALQSLEKIMHSESARTAAPANPDSALPPFSVRNLVLSLSSPATHLTSAPKRLSGVLPAVSLFPAADPNEVPSAAASAGTAPSPLSETELAAIQRSRGNRRGAMQGHREYLRVFSQNPPLIRMDSGNADSGWALRNDAPLRIRPTWPPYSKEVESRILQAGNAPECRATLTIMFTSVTQAGRVQVDLEKVSGPGTLPPRTIASAQVAAGRGVVVELDVTTSFQYGIRRQTLEEFVVTYQADGVAWLTPAAELQPGAHVDLEVEWPTPGGGGFRERGPFRGPMRQN
jgi:hypothetical protein